MWSRLFLTSLCILSLLAIRPLAAADDAVQLRLQHHIDSNCDGQPDINAKAVPGSCIIYEISALNTSDTPYSDVWVSAYLPEQTVLTQAYRYSHGQKGNPQVLHSTTQQDVDGKYLLKTRLDTLKPGLKNAVKLNYAVRIR